MITVAELGINHNGNLKTAIKMIKAAKDAGCDYIKLQKRSIPHTYSTQELDTLRDSPWGHTVRQQKYGLELTLSDYKEIDYYCDAIGMGWYASPWDLPSLEFLLHFDPPFIKIPSALMTHGKLLRKAAKTEIPIILSTGMCNPTMLGAAFETVQSNDGSVAYILHCTSTYPTDPKDMNLNVIPSITNHLCNKEKAGFSNHHPGILYATIAVSLGAQMVESHLTLDRSMYGSDQAASWEPGAFAKFIKYVKAIPPAMGDTFDILESEKPIVKKLRRVRDNTREI